MSGEGKNIFNKLDITEMAEAALTMHEFFTSLMGSGFTEDQALKIVIGMTRPSGTD